MRRRGMRRRRRRRGRRRTAKEGQAGPALGMYFSFVYSLADMGKRRKGGPAVAGYVGLG